MKQRRNPDEIHPPFAAYSHQTEIGGPARVLVMSGQVGAARDGTVPEDPAQQYALALDNVIANLHAAGMDVPDLDRLTTYLVEQIDREVRGRILREHLGDERPCTTLLYVAGLASPALKVEIDAWASSSTGS
ncbi:MAG: RidA family protein [Solirubrobacteraceae bacterium]